MNVEDMEDPQDVDLYWRHETEKAVLVAKRNGNGTLHEMWLPKSQIAYERYSTDTQVLTNRVWLTAPRALLAAKYLDDQIGVVQPFSKPRLAAQPGETS